MIPFAFVVGKVIYAPLAPSLLGSGGTEEETSETVRLIKVKTEMGTIEERVDLEDIDVKDYPSKVTISDSLILSDKNGLSPLKLDPGSPVKPLVLSDMVLEVTSPLASHLTGEISVLDTDFAEEVARKRMDRRIALLAEDKDDKPEEVAVVTPPEPKPVMVKPEPMPEPKPEPMPVKPEPAPVAAAPTSLSAEQIVTAMKESLESGGIKELDMNKVSSWEAVEDESFDGEDFQVGVATYKEMTILGEKTLQAKALFKKGKLEKWVHSNTGMEIR